MAWIIQLIEIHLYHFEINVESPIGLFEDEFIRTIKFIFPTLIIAEIIWLYLKNRAKVFYTGITLIIAYLFISFYNSFVFTDSKPAIYPDTTLNKNDTTQRNFNCGRRLRFQRYISKWK